jgi:hypothetical protein
MAARSVPAILHGKQVRKSPGRLSGGQGMLVADRGQSAARMPLVPVVVIDPGADLWPGWRCPHAAQLGLQGWAQLELQGSLPGLDDCVVQRRAGPGPSTG